MHEMKSWLVILAIINPFNAFPIQQQKAFTSAGSYAYVDSSGKMQQITYISNENGIHITSNNVPAEEVPGIIEQIEKQTQFNYNYGYFAHPGYFNPYFKTNQMEGASKPGTNSEIEENAGKINQKPHMFVVGDEPVVYAAKIQHAVVHDIIKNVLARKTQTKML